MTIKIARDGQEQGECSLEDARQLFADGTLLTTDWAWYEGLATWIPLPQVLSLPPAPGSATAHIAPAPSPLSEPTLTPASTPRERPVLVWVISLIFMICSALAVLILAALPLILSDIPLKPADRAAIHSLSHLDYGISLVMNLGTLVWSILLFQLKRAALPSFVALLVLGGLTLIHSLVSKGLEKGFGGLGLAGCLAAWILNFAILAYLWHLHKKNIFR